MATFSIHFDGPITINHKVPIRVLSRTYEHMQRSIDRAYLISVHGEVWKHARLKDDEYEETEFVAEYPREGGIILDAVREGAGLILDKIADAIAPVYRAVVDKSIESYEDSAKQYRDRLNYANAMGDRTLTFEQLLADPPEGWADAYSNRSIIKEIDQLVNLVSPERLDGSTVDLTLIGSKPYLPYEFDGPRAKNFHKIASKRELAAPVIVTAVIRSLDRGNKYTKPNAKIYNFATKREVVLRLHSIDDAEVLHHHHYGNPVRFFASPIVEALGFDVHGGDLMFISLA